MICKLLLIDRIVKCLTFSTSARIRHGEDEEDNSLHAGVSELLSQNYRALHGSNLEDKGGGQVRRRALLQSPKGILVIHPGMYYEQTSMKRHDSNVIKTMGMAPGGCWFKCQDRPNFKYS